MPGLTKDIVSLFLDLLLSLVPTLSHEVIDELKENAMYWTITRRIEFFLGYMEWDDFEQISLAFLVFASEDKCIINNYYVKSMEQTICVDLTPDALHHLRHS